MIREFRAVGLRLRLLPGKAHYELAPNTTDLQFCFQADGTPVLGGLYDETRFRPHGFGRLELPRGAFNVWLFDELMDVLGLDEPEVLGLLFDTTSAADALRGRTLTWRSTHPRLFGAATPEDLVQSTLLLAAPILRPSGDERLLSAHRTAVYRAQQFRRLAEVDAPEVVMVMERRRLLHAVWHLQTFGWIRLAEHKGLLGPPVPLLGPGAAAAELRSAKGELGELTYPWRVRKILEWLPATVASADTESFEVWRHLMLLLGFDLERSTEGERRDPAR